MDLRRLNQPPGSGKAQLEKVLLARKVGLFLVEEGNAEEEREVVLEIAEALARDISIEVRQTLAFELRRARHLPYALAVRIARDVEEVASSFLSHSMAFSDEELAQLARDLGESGRISIARRAHVPSVVALSIAETGGERSVTFLIRNPGAELALACGTVIDRFGDNLAMMDFLAQRGDIPIDMIHRLVARVSEKCREELIARHGLASDQAEALAGDTQAATMQRWIRDATRGALNEYVRQLEERGAITDKLLSDLTRRGGVRLFESVMAFRTGIDIDKIEPVVRSGSAPHIAKLARRAGFRDTRADRLAAAVLEGLGKMDA